MKAYWLIILYLLLPLTLVAQQQTEYNRKGDEAMARQDYRDARMWYEEGVSQCDSYSISKLTAIWRQRPEMRASMRSLMGKCLNCLNVKASERDATAISYLIDYYEYGIGTDANEQMLNYWKKQLVKLYEENNNPAASRKKKEYEPMHFFVGYAFSPEAPYGLTVGGVKRRIGWYARFKSNFNFDNYTGECTGTKDLIGAEEAGTIYQFTGEKKKKSYMATVGVILKCTSWLYASIGTGYGNRQLMYEYNTLSDIDNSIQETGWAKHLDNSYSGVAVDADIMLKFGHFYVSAGCNTLNFKYVDLNAGVGVFF